MNQTPTCFSNYRQRCTRCPVIFECKAQGDWLTLSRLVNQHWEICPGNLHGLFPPPAQVTPNPPSPPRLSTESLGVGGSNPDFIFIFDDSYTARKTEDQRKQELEDDEYTCEVEPTSVRCRGCNGVKQLDHRRRYYGNLWTKHRRICAGIAQMELAKRADAIPPSYGGDAMSTSDEEYDSNSWEGGEASLSSSYRMADEDHWPHYNSWEGGEASSSSYRDARH